VGESTGQTVIHLVSRIHTSSCVRRLLLRQAQGNHRDLPAEFRDTGGFHLGAVYILDQDKISILTDGYQSIHIQLTRSSLSSPTAACIREFRKPGLSSWKKLPEVCCRRSPADGFCYCTGSQHRPPATVTHASQLAGSELSDNLENISASLNVVKGCKWVKLRCF
jgi:hypothetical protein